MLRQCGLDIVSIESTIKKYIKLAKNLATKGPNMT